MAASFIIAKIWKQPRCPSGFPDKSVKNLPAMQETPVRFLGWEDLWRRDRLPTPVFLNFPCSSAGKESACNAGDLGLIPELGRASGKGTGYPLQYSVLKNPMDCIVPWGCKESDMTEQLSLHFKMSFRICLEK